MRVLGVNAIYHDPAAALVVDGAIVAAAEEERFSRRKHGKRPVPFAAWETPDLAARWCLERGGIAPEDVDKSNFESRLKEAERAVESAEDDSEEKARAEREVKRYKAFLDVGSN